MKRVSTALLALGVLVLMIGSYLLGADRGGEEPFAGTDSQATTSIQESAPDYEPWWHPVFEPSGEIESGLFALQAGLGGLVLGLCVGVLWGRRQGRASVAAEPAAPTTPTALPTVPAAADL